MFQLKQNWLSYQVLISDYEYVILLLIIGKK